MKVLILGDSTSFTGGIDPKAYPLVLADKEVWPSSSEIINPSVAGFTAADALVFYKHHVASSPPPDIVIVMVGNCDACKTPKLKGQPSVRRQFTRRFLPGAGTPRKRNLFLPNTFDVDFDPSLEQPESIGDFRANIKMLSQRVLRDGGLPLLIAPIANKEFPAGAGKGNFIFYRTFGLSRDLGDVANRVPGGLLSAIQASRRGDNESAMAIYKNLKNSNGSASSPTEVAEIAANNLAVLAAESGNLSQGQKILIEQLDQSPLRPEIFKFNLARIQRACGDEAQAAKSFDEAFEQDATMYRIREPYRKAIETVSNELSEVRFLDLAPHSSPQHMLDHCHPDADGHKNWANAIASVIGDRLTGDTPAMLIKCPMTPEYGHGNKSELHEFLFSSNASDEVTSDLHVKRLTDAAKHHPLFADGSDVSLRPPHFTTELGRLPDAYLTRLLAPYLSFTDDGIPEDLRVPEIASLQNRLDMFGNTTKVHIQAEQNATISATHTRLVNLKATIEEHLRRHLMKGPEMDYRYHSTIFWYFRESARYGSHSCQKMLYDRQSIDSALEAIYGVAAIADLVGVNERAWLSHIGCIVRETLNIHADASLRWIENYRLAKPTTNLQYVQAKQNLATQI